MPTDDLQILVTGQAAAPAGFVVPGNGQIKPKAMNAVFDGTNAVGDFTPALEIVSDAGIVVARVAATTVTAGNSAEVTWAPFLEAPTSVPTTAFLAQSSLTQARSTAQTIHTGAVTALAPNLFTSAPGWVPGVFATAGLPSGVVTFAAGGTVAFTLVVDFPAGAYDRYIELTLANTGVTEETKSPRVREGATPDGDRLTLTAVVNGGGGPPATTVTANIFQASGVDKTITAMFLAWAITGKVFLL